PESRLPSDFLFRPSCISLRQHLDLEQRRAAAQVERFSVGPGERKILRPLRRGDHAEMFALCAEYLHAWQRADIDAAFAVDDNSVGVALRAGLGFFHALILPEVPLIRELAVWLHSVCDEIFRSGIRNVKRFVVGTER